MSLRRFAVLAVLVALVLALPFAVSAGGGKGKITKLDTAANVVVLEDGTMYRMLPDTVILVEEKAVKFDTLKPGTAVIIRSGEPVQLKDGQYILIAPSASPATR